MENWRRGPRVFVGEVRVPVRGIVSRKEITAFQKRYVSVSGVTE